MPQMNPILLSNVESGKDKAAVAPSNNNASTESDKSNDFSTALAQVSTENSKASKQERTSDGDAKQGENVATDESVSTAPDHQESDNTEAGNSDEVSHVLAQINLASKFANDQEVADNGDDLPPEEGLLADNPLAILSTEEQVDEQAAEESLPSSIQGVTKSADEDNSLKLVAELDEGRKQPGIEPVLLPINGLPDESQQAGTLVDQLSKQQLDRVMSETGLSKDELMALPPHMLLAIFQQIEGIDTAELVKSTGMEQHLLAVTSNPQALSQLVSKANQYLATQAISAVPGEQTNRSSLGAEQQTAANSLSGNSQAGATGDGRSILGEAKTDTTGEPDLGVSRMGQTKQAELLTEPKPSVDALKGAKLTVALNSDVGDAAPVDNKPVNVTTPTLHGVRVESPAQYQLSIKPQGDPVQHMQEMIQKFSPVMRQQLVAMVSQGVQHAEIRLDPPELGHMMVRIQVQGEQTQVQFQVAQHQTRDLVEQAIPRLREMLAEQGMQLTDSNVSQGGKDQGSADGQSERSAEGLSDMDEISAEESLLTSNSATSYRSGIDYYA